MTQNFRCRILDAEGSTRSLERRAASAEALARELRREGSSLIECEPVAGDRAKKLTLPQVLEFTQSLELLFNQNLSLKDAVRVLGTLKTSGALEALIASLENRLTAGQSMAAALSEHSRSFPPLYLGLVRVGEMTGTLKHVLPQLSRYLAERKRLRDKVLGSLMYPALILCVLIIGMVLLTSFVLPTFIQVAESLNRAGAGDLKHRLVAFQAVFVSALVLLPLLGGALAAARLDPRVRLSLDRILLTTAPLRAFFSPMEMQGLCFGLEILLESGYTIETALGEIRQVTDNTALIRAIDEVRLKTKKGTKLSRAFREGSIFPSTFCTWVAVGEEAHDLRKVFSHLRAYYEYEFEKLTQRVMALMEPGMILAVGGILLLVISQFLGPIFRLLGGAT